MLLNCIYYRATFENLQHAAKGNQVRSAGTPFKIMREQINQVMSYFRVCTHRYRTIFIKFYNEFYFYFLININLFCFRFLTDFDTEMSELSLLYTTLEDIFKHISLWMTPVADMPSIIFSGGSLNNDSAVSIFFHTFSLFCSISRGFHHIFVMFFLLFLFFFVSIVFSLFFRF